MLPLLTVACGGGGGGGGSTTPPPPPSITSFTAAKAVVTQGSATALKATFANGTGTVDHGVGTLASGGTVSTGPLGADTTFTLTVSGAGGTTTRSASVQAVAPASQPLITAPSMAVTGAAGLTASVPDQPGCTFAWTIIGGTFGGVSATASGKDVSFNTGPVGSLTLKCTATNAAGDSSAAGVASIQVIAVPAISSFTVAKGSITAGTSTTLTASFSGGTGVIDHGVGAVTSGATVSTGPLSATTTFTLTVTNALGGSTTRTLSENVVPAPAITSFSPTAAQIPVGTRAGLIAVFSGGTGAVDQGIGPVTSGAAIQTGTLASDTTFTLTVTNALGDSVTRATTVGVVAPPTITSFTAASASIPAGTATVLTPVFNGGTARVDHGLGMAASGVGINTGNLWTTTTFTLTVTNAVGISATRAVTVNVVSPPDVDFFAQNTVFYGESDLLASVPDPLLAGATLQWVLADGSASVAAQSATTGSVLSYGTGSTPGTYQLSLNAQDASGRSATRTRALNVVRDQFLRDIYAPLQRVSGTATLLKNGKVLVAGGTAESPVFTWGVGWGAPIPVPTAQLFDPLTGAWADAGPMLNPRSGHTATLLTDGRVLVAGGADATTFITAAEIYDPSTNAWSPAGTMQVAEFGHTATLLLDGQVLVAGGCTATGPVTTAAEIYDPAKNSWTLTGDMVGRRYAHGAALLGDGRVLVMGGENGLTTTPNTTAEIFDPVTGAWVPAPTMSGGRSNPAVLVLPDGRALVTGGSSGVSGETNPQPWLPECNAEIYDPRTDTWTVTGQLAVSRTGGHGTVLLPDGKVLLVGGRSLGGLAIGHMVTTSTAEIFDPATGQWSGAGQLGWQRALHTTTLLQNGWVLAAGGDDGGISISGAELYDPAAGQWYGASNMVPPWRNFTATPLPDGRVLYAGGGVAGLFNPSTDTWSSAGVMVQVRFGHSATLLGDGRVLVAGGNDGAPPPDTKTLNTAEIYDPQQNAWSAASSMKNTRESHGATLLPNGKVLVVGSVNFQDPSIIAELYDPTTDAWLPTGNIDAPGMAELGFYPDAPAVTLLQNGKVLAAGNHMAFGGGRARLYDPATNTWAETGTMLQPRRYPKATLLQDGRVLVAGGADFATSSTVASAELYDPGTGTWSSAGSMNISRQAHTLTSLDDGQALVVGGFSYDFFQTKVISQSAAERYDPVLNIWTLAGGLTKERDGHTAVNLGNGKVVVVGGYPGYAVEFYKH